MAPRRRQRAHPRPRRLDQESAGNVEEWVYRFLGNLAAIEENKSRARRRLPAATVRFAKPKRTSRRRFRPPTPFSWDRLARGAAPSSRAPDSDDEVDRVDDRDAAPATNSTDRTLLQRINRYIRAGIAEGKRRAKLYVQKALSFALETGYLVPADREGKLLRVSRSLVKPARKRRSSGRLQKRTGKLRKRKSIVGQGDERRPKGQARKRPREESVQDAQQLAQQRSRKTPSSGGSRDNRTLSSRSPSRSARHHETLSASQVERKPATQPAVAAARPRSAPNTR